MILTAATLDSRARRRSLVAGAAALTLLLGALSLPTAHPPAPGQGLVAAPATAPEEPAAPLQRTQQPLLEQEEALDRTARRAGYLALGAKDPEALAREVAPVLAGCDAGRKAA